jgi:tetratricopeptide (TPR) repeat protein
LRLVALASIVVAGIASGQPQSVDAESWQRAGLTLHLQNKYAEAIPAFREAIRLNPSLWTSHLFLGICLYRTNQFGEALTSIERADRLAPEKHAGRDEIDFWLGATRIALKKPLPGLQRLERLLARNPKHTDALELATRTYADLSSSLWNDVADKHFDTAPGYEVHGYALQSEGNRKDALEAFRTSKELDPRRAGPGLEISRLLLHDGKAEEALAVLKRELALPDAGAETPYYAGLAAVQLGRYAEAAPLLESAARWLPQNLDAPLALAQVYLALKEPGKAVTAARQAVAVAPASSAAHELLLAALTQTGQTQELEKEQQRWQKLPAK